MGAIISSVQVLFFVALTTAASLLAQGQERDLTRYDHIGPYNLVKFAATPKTDQVEGEVRDFLWNHLQEHRRGTVTITHQYVEGVIRAAYFVELDRRGRWGIFQYTDTSWLQSEERSYYIFI